MSGWTSAARAGRPRNQANARAALLVFRLLYLILPLLFSLIVVVVFERGRIGERVRQRGRG
jgi:uncharacterized membrane protein YbhN (UPF0104 family)